MFLSLSCVLIFLAVKIHGITTKDDVQLLMAGNKKITLFDFENNRMHLVQSVNTPVYSIDYHLKKDLVFQLSNMQITKSPLSSPTTATPTAIKNVTSCRGFAVDWEQDRIYWADCSTCTTTIKSMDLNGENDLTLIKLTEEDDIVNKNAEENKRDIARMEVDPYKRVLFWIADGAIDSCTLAGQEHLKSMNEPKKEVSAMTLDLVAQRVYFTLNEGSLHSMSYKGSDTQEHFSRPEELKGLVGLGLFQNTLYWVNSDCMCDSLIDNVINKIATDIDSIVNRAHLDFSNSNFTKVGKHMDEMVCNMKAVHPYLQQSPQHQSLCKNKSCSHSCVVIDNTAGCECPEGLHLNTAGVTCLGVNSCFKNEDCSSDSVCRNNSCTNPCDFACGVNTDCKVVSHAAICTCKAAHSGNPTEGCQKRKKEYLPTHNMVTWFEARSNCKAHGMTLATIMNKEENDAIVNAINIAHQKYIRNHSHNHDHNHDHHHGHPHGHGRKHNSWTAGNDLEKEGQFVWADSDLPVSYTNWSKTQPGNSSDEEDCLVVSTSGDWNYYKCSRRRHYVCQRFI